MDFIAVSPYKLLVTVIGARNLPIADFTTSDPYVIINVGGKTIGRTKTIYKNHLAPEWGEGFYAAVFHVDQDIELQIFDEDQGKADDLMGTVTINLRSLPINRMHEAMYEVTNAGSFKANATISLAILLGRKEGTIKVVGNNEVVNRRKRYGIVSPGGSAPNTEDNAASQDIIVLPQQKALEADVLWNETHDLLRLTFADFFAERPSTHFNNSLLRDLLYDSLAIRKNSRAAQLASNWNYSDSAFHRYKLRLVNSTKVSLRTGTFERYGPIEENTIQLNLSEDDTRFILLTFPNRFAMWTWAKWLKLAYDVWHGRVKRADIPEWATEEPTITANNLHIRSSDGNVREGRVSLSLDRSHELQCVNAYIGLTNLLSFVVAADSVVPRNYCLEVEFISQGEFGAASCISPETSDRSSYRPTSGRESAQSRTSSAGSTSQPLSPQEHAKRASKRISIVGAFKGTIHGAVSAVGAVATVGQNVVVGAKDIAVDAAVGVASTAVGAARTIATGNPIGIVQAGTEKVMGVGSHLASVVTGVPTAVFLQKNSLLVIACRDEAFRLKRGEEHLGFYIDFTREDLESKTQGGAATVDFDRILKQNKSMKSEKQPVVFPDKQPCKLALDMYMLRGTEGSEKVVGETRCKLSALINKDLVKDIVANVDGNKKVITDDNHSLITEIDFNKHIGKRIYCIHTNIMNALTLSLCLLGITLTVVSAVNIIIPEPATGAKMSGVSKLTGASVYAKCKCVGPNGKSGYKAIGGEFRTKPVPVTSAGRQNVIKFDTDFILRAENLAVMHAFVRIEFFVEDITGTSSIGCAFVPFEFCAHKKETEYNLPITRFHASSSVYPLAAKSGTGYGEVKVKVKAAEEEGTHADAEKLAVRATVHEVSIFNSAWLAECVPSGSRDAEAVDVEKALLTALPEGLRLSDIVWEKAVVATKSAAAVVAAGLGARDSMIGVSADVSHSHTAERDQKSFVSAKKAAEREREKEGDREIVVEFFENSRRTPYPPFNWADNAFTRSRFSNMDFGVGYSFEEKEKAKPPRGYEWIDGEAWRLDKSHLKTDDDGWIYGLMFGKLLSDQKQHVSITKPAHMHARRRKWVRRVRLSASTASSASSASPNPLHTYATLAWRDCNASMIQALFDDANSTKKIAEKDLKLAASRTISTGSDHDSLHGPGASSIALAARKEWRKIIAEDSHSAVLLTCKERENDQAALLLPWKRISSIAVVTASVLSFSFSVERYFAQQDTFRHADVEVFVSNCPAEQLRSLMEERIFFCNIRDDIRLVADEARPIGTIKEEGEGDDDDAEIEAEGVPETEELSLGSEIMSQLDDLAITLQGKIDRLKDSIAPGQSEDKGVAEELNVLHRRLCRLRLYMASLIAVEMEPLHQFNVSVVHQTLEEDFAKSRRIVLDSEVATANNRIEYLLDMAEKRIRDAALCGWKFRHSGFEQCIEIFSNDYFVEIVGLLAAFFEGKGQSSVKGLTSKLELLHTFMKHNDRLKAIVESALRPYALTTSPPAVLSVFLDFKVLTNWYKDILKAEMRQRVSDVLDVWKDVEKDVTGQASLYKFPIPWIPQRVEGGTFFTNIPEDLVELLMTYLTYARINGEDVAPSFQKHIGELDGKVFSAYANAFIYLAESYRAALTTGKASWQSLSDEEELSEYSTFVSAVANDAVRVLSRRLMIPKKMVSTEDAANAMEKDAKMQIDASEREFELLRVRALDQLSCVVFMCVFHGKEDALKNGLAGTYLQYHVEREKDRERLAAEAEDGVAPGHQPLFFEGILDDADALLEQYESFLDTDNAKLLVELVVAKCLLLFLSLIADLRARGDVYDAQSPVLQTLRDEGAALKDRLLTMLGDWDRAFSPLPYVELSVSLSVLTPLLDVLTHKLGEKEFELSIAAVKAAALSTSSRPFAVAVSLALESVLSLRGVRSYFSAAQKAKEKERERERESKRLKPIKEKHSHSQSPVPVPPSPTHAQTPATPPAAPAAPANRRASLTGFFSSFTHGSASAPHPSATAAPALDLRTVAESLDEDDSDEEVEDDENELRRQAEESKRLALECWAEELVQAIRKDASKASAEGPNTALLSPTAALITDADDFLVSASVFDRVFSESPHKARYSLLAQLAQTALSPDKRTLSITAEQAAARPSMQSRASVFGDLFRGTSRSGGDALSVRPSLDRAASKFSSSAGDSASTAVTTPGGSNRQSVRTNLNVPMAGANHQQFGSDGTPLECKLTIVLYHVKIFHLFYVDYFRAPKPYLIYRVGNGVAVRTKTIELVDGVADWSTDADVFLHIADITSSEMEIEIDVVYEGYLQDNIIATAKVPFNPYDPPSFVDKEIALDDFSKSPKGQQAAKKAQTEGRTMPSMIGSIRIIPNLL